MQLDRVMLLTTDSCLLNCEYCYMKLGKKKMSVQVAKDSIDWSLSHANTKSFSIEFFGGDPLLNLEILEPSIEHGLRGMEHYKIQKFWFTAFLNGYNPKLNEFLDIIEKYKHLFHIQFSMDGCRESQDIGRLAHGGKSVWDDVIKSMEIVKNRLGKLQIHAVITPENIQHLNKSVDFMLSMGSNQLEFGIARENGWTSEKLLILEEQFKVLADRFIQWIKEGKEIVSGNLLSPISSIINKQKTSCYCGKNGFLIGHDGAIYPCQRFEKYGEKFKMGSIYTGVNEESYNFWKTTDCYHLEGCNKCTLFEMCIGPCIGANQDHMGDVHKLIPGVCQLWKIIYKEAIRIWKECKDIPHYKALLERYDVERGGKNVRQKD